MSQKDELRERIQARRLKLQARLKELQADGRSEAREAASSIEQSLEELGKHLSDGWEDTTERLAGTLNKWLTKTEEA